MMRFTIFLPIALCFALVQNLCLSQDQRPTVGLVLTGGGARGAAHVGVISALEDSGIPIDYVVGTSVGALVGGYYAAGWSPEMMWSMLSTDEFQARVKGQPQDEFAFRSDYESPGVLSVRLGTDRGDVKGHLISSLTLDWALMEELSPACAAAKSNFDSLIVPFRCVASNVLAKKDTVFAEGNLSQSIRASMSFPFYMPPVWMDGSPFYDGGLYNNRPVDVMIESFNPDIILVSGTESAISDFNSDDLISQIEALVVQYADPIESGTDGVFEISTDLDIETLDFGASSRACEQGYSRGLEFVDSHRGAIPVLSDLDHASRTRGQFVSKLEAFKVNGISVEGMEVSQKRYAERILNFAEKNRNAEALKRRLFFLEANSHIGRVFPTAEQIDDGFEVHLDVTAERDLQLEVGGSVSSQPLSMGHGALGLNHFSRVPMTARLTGTIGSLYSDLGFGVALHLGANTRVVLEPVVNLRRWNYTRDLVGFLQEIRPTFFTSSEREWGGKVRIASGLRSDFCLSLLEMQTEDNTYSDWLFSSEEAVNQDRFSGLVLGGMWSYKSLNKKQFATRGSRLELGGHFFTGTYSSDYTPRDEPGTRDSLERERSFFRGFAKVESYLPVTNKLTIGLNTEARFSNEKLQTTYRGSLAQATSYAPMLGASAMFLENFRGYNYGAVGAIVDLEMHYGVHLRSEVHVFKARKGIVDGDKGPRLVPDSPSFWMAGVRAWKELPIGPLSIGMEYYKSERSPIFFEVLIGCRLFQPSSRR